MIVAPHVPAPNSPVGRTMAFLAVGLSIAVGLGTLIYLHHQVKLLKLQVDHHESTAPGTVNKKSPA